VISVSWQQICLGKAAAGKPVDVQVTDRVIQVWDGNQLLETVARTTTGEVRKKRASVARTEDQSPTRVSTRNRNPHVKQEPELNSPTRHHTVAAHGPRRTSSCDRDGVDRE
jgi:ribosome-binding protein aMBF1 (putative translation factor)